MGHARHLWPDSGDPSGTTMTDQEQDGSIIIPGSVRHSHDNHEGSRGSPGLSTCARPCAAVGRRE
eukprot:6341085-Prorocentrum_lima.AAC.1